MRGIQPGTVATDKFARKLDLDCKQISKKVFQDLDIDELTYQTKLTAKQKLGKKTSCQPDGGLWFFKDKLVAVFEGKKQQNAGNAIERWYKNNYVCRKINPEVSYITFATGEGAAENGVIPKILDIAHQKYNEYLPGDNSCFLSVEPFTSDFLYTIITKVIKERTNNEAVIHMGRR